MRFLIISVNGDFLPVAYRMQEEGADVSVYIHDERFRTNYDGLIKKKLSLKELCDFPLGEETTAIFDMVRPFRDTPADRALVTLLYGEKTERPNLGDGIFGPFSDLLRDHGCKVIGMSRWTEEIELNRARGKVVAGELGLRVAPVFECKKQAELLANAAAMREAGTRMVYKPNGNDSLAIYIERQPGEIEALARAKKLEVGPAGAILEPFIAGVTVDEEVWWNGERFLAFNSTIEHKRFGAGDTGPNVGSMLNLVWAKEASRSIVPWEALREQLVSAGYIGPIDATFQVQGDAAYFLEWCPRIGYDAFFCLSELLRGKVAHFLDNGFRVALDDERLAMSARVSLPPYPAEPKGDEIDGIPVLHDAREHYWLDVRMGEGGLECSGADGILGVVTSLGDELRDVAGNLQRKLRSLRVAGDLQWRSDLEIFRAEWLTLKRQPWTGVIDLA